MSERFTATGPETLYGILGDYLADAELFARLSGDVLQIGPDIMTSILNCAAGRGEARPDVTTRVAALPTELFRNELFLRRTPPTPAVIAEIIDDVFLPLVSRNANDGGSPNTVCENRRHSDSFCTR
jgi:hypothetical protein